MTGTIREKMAAASRTDCCQGAKDAHIHHRIHQRQQTQWAQPYALSPQKVTRHSTWGQWRTCIGVKGTQLVQSVGTLKNSSTVFGSPQHHSFIHSFIWCIYGHFYGMNFTHLLPKLMCSVWSQVEQCLEVGFGRQLDCKGSNLIKRLIAGILVPWAPGRVDDL